MSGPEFIPVPVFILGRTDVSWGAKMLFGVLHRYVRRGREAFPSIERLSDDLGATPRRTVQRWISELEGAGLITIERTGRASTYRIAAGPGTPPEEPPRGARNGASEDGDNDAMNGASDAQQVAPRNSETMRNSRHISGAETGASDAPKVASRKEERIEESSSREGSLKDALSQSARARESGEDEGAERERDEAPASARPPSLRGSLIRGYAERYKRAFADAWQSASKASSDIDIVAAYCAAAEDPEARAAAVLDGAFADAWMTTEGRRVPWGAIAHDPGRYVAATAKTAALDTTAQLARISRLMDQARSENDHARLDALKAELDDFAGRSSGAAGGHPVPAGHRSSDAADRDRQGEAREVRKLFRAVG